MNRMEQRDCLIQLSILIVGIWGFGYIFESIDYDYIDNMINGEKNVQEGEFTILDKNTTNDRAFWVSSNTFTFMLESNTKERYVVQVSEKIYHSYLVNEKIKATLETYSKDDTCNLLEVKGVVANE